MTAFLVILPFNSGFGQIQDEQRYVYLAAFLCSLLSLILFTAPATHPRIQRPLRDREKFKTISTRLMVAGLVPLSAALVLSTQLTISQVIPARWVSLACAAIVLVAILIVWWGYPLVRQR